MKEKDSRVNNKNLWTGQKRNNLYQYEKDFMKKLYMAMSKDGHSAFSNIASLYINQDNPKIYIDQFDVEINFTRLNRVSLVKYMLHYSILTLLKIHEDKIIKFKSGEKKELVKILKSLK